jgi:MFS family permease
LQLVISRFVEALRPTTELLRLPAYRRLLLAQAVSEVGNWLTSVALILLIVRLTEHPAAAAWVVLAKLVPRMLIYPFGGVLADRLDRRQLMIATDLARAGLAVSLLLVQSVDGLWWALTATALAQALASLFNPAAMAVVPAVAPPERLAPANALIDVVKEVAFFVGPMLGALVIAAAGVELAFLLDAGTFIVSALFLVGLRGLPRPASTRAPLAVRRELAEGWAAVRSQRSLLVLFVVQVILGALIAAVNVLLVPMLVTHWSAPEATLGWLYAAIGAGCLLGALLATRLSPGGYMRTALSMLGLIGAATLGLGLVPWLGPALALLFVIGLVLMVGDVASFSAIQASVADDRLGRVFGLLFWAIAVGQAVGASLGWAAGASPPALLVAGLGLLTLGAAVWLALAQRPAREPAAGLTELTRPS